MNDEIKCFVPVRITGGGKNAEDLLGIEVNNLEIRVFYSLGGESTLTHKKKPRGYSVVVTPVKTKKEGVFTLTEYNPMAGVSFFLLEVSRKSESRLAEACGLAKRYAKQLIEWCCDAYGLDTGNYEINFPIRPVKKKEAC